MIVQRSQQTQRMGMNVNELYLQFNGKRNYPKHLKISFICLSSDAVISKQNY